MHPVKVAVAIYVICLALNVAGLLPGEVLSLAFGFLAGALYTSWHLSRVVE